MWTLGRKRAAEREAQKASAARSRQGLPKRLAPKKATCAEPEEDAFSDAIEAAANLSGGLPNTSLVVAPIRQLGAIQQVHSAVPECATLLLNGDVRRLHHYAVSVLWPSFGHHIVTTDETLSAAWFRLSMTDELLLNSFVWTSALEMSLYNATASNHAVMLRCQNNVIQDIRSQIDRGQVSDSVLFAVLTLTIRDTDPRRAVQEDVEDGYSFGGFAPPLRSLGWLDSFSHFRWTQSHIDALKRLVTARGGLQNVTAPGIAEQLQATDLLQASVTLSRPNFALCRLYRHVLNHQVSVVRPPRERVDIFPLAADSLEFKDLLLDMRMYCRLLETVAEPSSSRCDGSSSSSAPSWETNVCRNLIQFRLLNLPRDDDNNEEGRPSTPHHEDERLCRLAALIFSYGVIYPLARRQPLSTLTKQLRVALKDRPSYRHQSTPHASAGSGSGSSSSSSEFLLWAVVLGGLAARDTPHESFFVDSLTDLAARLHIGTFEALTEIMRKFLWLGHACDQGARELWVNSCVLSTSTGSEVLEK